MDLNYTALLAVQRTMRIEFGVNSAIKTPQIEALFMFDIAARSTPSMSSSTFTERERVSMEPPPPHNTIFNKAVGITAGRTPLFFQLQMAVITAASIRLTINQTDRCLKQIPNPSRGCMASRDGNEILFGWIFGVFGMTETEREQSASSDSSSSSSSPLTRSRPDRAMDYILCITDVRGDLNPIDIIKGKRESEHGISSSSSSSSVWDGLFKHQCKKKKILNVDIIYL